MEVKPLSFSDHVIATDILFETKAAIKDLSVAITEATSDKVHTFLREELRSAIAYHERIYGFLQNRGIYDAYNIPEQLQKDISYATEVLGH
jgi:similar to spore coat protein